MIALQKKDVKYVVTYNDRTFIKKIVFQNGIVLDVFPEVQEILYMHLMLLQTNNNYLYFIKVNWRNLKWKLMK